MEVKMELSVIVSKANMAMMLMIAVRDGELLLLRRGRGYERGLRTGKVGNGCEMIVVMCMKVKDE